MRYEIILYENFPFELFHWYFMVGGTIPPQWLKFEIKMFDSEVTSNEERFYNVPTDDIWFGTLFVFLQGSICISPISYFFCSQEFST